MNFGKVIEALKEGKRASMKGWNLKGLYIQLQIPDEHSKMTRPYLYITTPANSTNHYGEEGNKENRIPWSPSNTDMFSEDWEIID